MTAPWTDPDPFVSPTSSPISYCGIYFEEIEREVNQQCSALGITKPTWYRYDSTTERTEIDPSADSSGESLIGYDYSWKPYITDIRDTYEGVSGATGLFSAWGITKQEYLEAKYTAPYSSWIHSAGALSEDGDLYDRDLGELRSYIVPSIGCSREPEEIWKDLLWVSGSDDPEYRIYDGYDVGDGEPPNESYWYALRSIFFYRVSDYPSTFAAAKLKISYKTQSQSAGGPGIDWPYGGCQIVHFTDSAGIAVTAHYDQGADTILSFDPSESSGWTPLEVNVTSALLADKSAGHNYTGFRFFCPADFVRDGEAYLIMLKAGPYIDFMAG